MEKLKNIRTIYMFATGAIALVLLCAYAFNEGQRTIRTKTEIIFEEAIAKDFNNRKVNMPSNIRGPLGKKIKSVNVTSNGNKGIIELEFASDEYVDDRQFIQFFVFEGLPFQPDSLNALFRQSLEDMGISTQGTGIIYQYQGKKQYSHNDTTTMQSAYLTREHNLLFKKLESVQGWVKYVPTSIISHIPAWLGSCVLAYVLLLASTGLYWIVKRERNKRSKLQAETEQWKTTRKEYERNVFGRTLQLGDMTLYERTQTIHANGIIRHLSPNEFQLLCMFVTAPDHILHAADIQETFWRGNTDATNNLHGLIRLLRLSLKPFPNFRLDNLKEKRFKLEFNKKNNETSADD